MKLGDRALGALTLLGGVLLYLASLGFSPIPGQQYGAETLPRAIAFVASLTGIGLLVKGFATENGASLATLSDWTRNRASWARLGGTAVLVVIYIAIVERVGFTLTAFGLVLALLTLTRVRPVVALPVTIVTVIVVQFVFARILLVPLPRGDVLSLPW